MKKYTLRIAIMAALFATAASATAADKVESRSILADSGEKDLHESLAIAADARVEIANVRGTVTVSAWDKPEVDLEGSLGRDSKLQIGGDGMIALLVGALLGIPFGEGVG